MKSRIISILFLLVSLVVVFFVVMFFWGRYSQEEQQGPRVIIPGADSKTIFHELEKETSSFYTDLALDSNLSLNPEESMIANFSIDFDDDGTDDLVLAIKTVQDSSISIIPMRRNPQTGEYERQETFKTAITQTKTLSLYALDLVGEHKTAIVCSGLDQDNAQVMLVLYMREGRFSSKIAVIGDFRADGEIKIVKNDRSEAYNLLQTTGASFPIVVSSSDPEAPNTLDQIQRTYNWSKFSGSYELTSETKIPGKKIEEQYLRQLKNLSASEFEEFLDGLWYKTSSQEKSEPKYLLMNKQDREIVFFDSNQEVYSWNSSTPTRYGLYIIANNKSITTMKRRITVSLSGIDEVSVRISEDVKLKIMVDSTWNGTYKKLPKDFVSKTPTEDSKESKIPVFTDKKAWQGSNGSELVITENSYTKTQGALQEKGLLNHSVIKGTPVLQFRSPNNETKAFTYTIRSLKDNQSNGLEPQETESLELIPVVITAKGIEVSKTERVFYLR